MRWTRGRLVGLLILVCGAGQVLASAQQQTSTFNADASLAAQMEDSVARIIAEEHDRSEVMETARYLSDVIGPRLTGSPNMKRANQWTLHQLTGWGLSAGLEPWGPFGRGWSLEHCSVETVSSESRSIPALAKAWSPGTPGRLVADAVWFKVQDVSDMQRFKGLLRRKIVLIDPLGEVKDHFEPSAKRLTDGDLLVRANASPPVILPPFRGDEPGTIAFRNRKHLALEKLKFLREQGAAVLVSASGRDAGILDASSADAVRLFDPADPLSIVQASGQPYTVGAQVTPQIVLPKEEYNHLARRIEAGDVVKLAVDIAVRWFGGDNLAYNTIAEIPGTDKRNEAVMLGAHLDSWQGGGGATDNAAGVAVVMEAMRILKVLNLNPRRTIRLALWSGEEQGLLGSDAYVTAHFGEGNEGKTRDAGNTVIHPTSSAQVRRKPEYEAFDVYFNLDRGTGKIRGLDLLGDEAARPFVRAWLKPFRTVGADTISVERAGGSDQISFDEIGLPAFQFIQDTLDYFSVSHHSNQDVFERLQPDDLKEAATIMAAVVYQAAMAEQRLPRKAGF